MMRRTIGLLAITAVTLLACGGDDGPTITDEQRQLVMGQTEGLGVVIYSDFVSPLVLERDEVHINVRELDLNSDGVIDVSIKAFEEFAGDKGLTLTIESDSTEVSITPEGVIKPLTQGDIVTLTSETWGKMSEITENPLAVRTAGNTTGVWNMQGRRYIAFKIEIGNSRFLSWIEISVSDFDNYSLYNFVLRQVP